MQRLPHRQGQRAAPDGGCAIESFDGQVVDGVDEVVVADRLPSRPRRCCRRSASTSTRCSRRRAQLAPLIDPNEHSCGTVYPHGAKELAQPEAGFYLVGMKSYGRATSFLALTGFEQTRSVAAAIAGDHEAAARVELTLPDTGVCGGSGLFDDESAEGGGCCAAPQTELVTLGRSPER